jgi:hypothetical protein
MEECFSDPFSWKSTNMHCKFFNIDWHCTSKKLKRKSYYDGILEFNGFKSLFLINEKNNSIGAIAN